MIGGDVKWSLVRKHPLRMSVQRNDFGRTGRMVPALLDAKIRWGEGGDWARCVAELGKYVSDPEGLCERYHEIATGMSTAEHAKLDRGGNAKPKH